MEVHILMDMKRSMVGALSAALLLGALPGVAAGQDEATGSLPPEGVEWTLSTMGDAALPEGVEVTLFLNGGEVVGSAGCNSYFGSYVLDGDALTFPDPFGTTRKLCDEATMAVEDAYLPALQETTSWSIDDAGSLTLSGTDGSTLRYSEATVDVTATDVASLTATLEALQQQIDAATADVDALAQQAAGINVNRFDQRLSAVEESVAELEQRLGGTNPVNLRRRIDANEQEIAQVRQTANDARRTANANAQAITALQDQVAGLDQSVRNLRQRVTDLEAADKALDARVSALESAQPKPEQPLP